MSARSKPRVRASLQREKEETVKEETVRELRRVSGPVNRQPLESLVPRGFYDLKNERRT
jgi:hypothetical protein